MYNTINFKTIRSKLTASGNINKSILIYKLMGPVSFLPPKEWKKAKKQQENLSD